MVVYSYTQENSLKTLIQRSEHIPLMGPHKMGERGGEGGGSGRGSPRGRQCLLVHSAISRGGETTDIIMAIDIKLTVFF